MDSEPDILNDRQYCYVVFITRVHSPVYQQTCSSFFTKLNKTLWSFDIRDLVDRLAVGLGAAGASPHHSV